MKGQQQSQGDNSANPMWWIGGILGILGVIWFQFQYNIVHYTFIVLVKEAKLMWYMVRFVEDILNSVGLSLPILYNGDDLIQSVEFMNSANPAAVPYMQFFQQLAIVSKYVSIPLSFILLSLVLLLLLFHNVVFKQKYTMETLLNNEVVNWAGVTPLIGTKLIDNDLDTGIWAMSETPMQFAKKNGLLEEINKDGKVQVKLKRVYAHRTFSLQMGPYWESRVDKLPQYVQALFAAFAAKAEHNSKGCSQLLTQISASYKKGKLSFKGSMPLLKKHIKGKNVAKAVGAHAYLLTAMSSLLEAARNDGVLANSEFIWLKGVDRRMWYMLTSIGRRTTFCEVAGPYAHWIIEKKLRRPLKVPVVDKAVDGLEGALEELIYKPEE